MKTLRSHQEAAREIGRAIRNGIRNDKIIAAYVTPGGGKTLFASLFAHELFDGEIIKRVLVICPRKTLKRQMATGFSDAELGLSYELGEHYEHRNQQRLVRTRIGLVTTYQDVAANPAKWKRFASEDKTLVILDEAHHLQSQDDSTAPLEEEKEAAGWTKAVAPIVEAASRVLLMTGSPKRDNQARIAFLTYDDSDKPKPFFDVKYTRRDALAEHAIINVSAKLCDGNGTVWIGFSEHKRTLSQVTAKEESRTRNALLKSPEYRNELLKMALDEYREYRNELNPRARMIVICADQLQAKSVHSFVLKSGHESVLAIHSESQATKRVNAFRDLRQGKVLVTCQMAYEGLDVPDCTHLVALTHIRARSWLEQALSRVTRFDKECRLPWERQFAFLFAPADPQMVQFLGEWIDEQDPACNPRPAAGRVLPLEGQRRSMFRIGSGELTDVIHADTFGVYSDTDQRRIRALEARYPSIVGVMAAAERLRLARDVFPDDSKIPDPTESAA